MVVSRYIWYWYCLAKLWYLERILTKRWEKIQREQQEQKIPLEIVELDTENTYNHILFKDIDIVQHYRRDHINVEISRQTIELTGRDN